MKNRYFLFFWLLLLLMEVTGCNMKEPVVQEKSQEDNKQIVELTISAASSLKNALNEIKTTFEKDHPFVKITYNFGASGSLQQQISQGAPVDIFISASEDNFEKLVQDGLIHEKYRTDLVGNELVLVVPAGKFGKETLKKLNIWTFVEDNVVNAKDVRQVLTFVETGNVDAGVVYKSDTMISTKVKIVAIAEDDLHEPIIYPVGVIKKSSNKKEAVQIYDYLQKEKSMEIFLNYGLKGLK